MKKQENNIRHFLDLIDKKYCLIDKIIKMKGRKGGEIIFLNYFVRSILYRPFSLEKYPPFIFLKEKKRKKERKKEERRRR